MLIVLAGKPGTGKTTLARLVAAERAAAHLRVDAIEAAIVRSGLATRHSIGATGYAVAQEIAASCLAVGTTVVVDAVSPVAQARQGWRDLGAAVAAPVRAIEVEVDDATEHRRRVEQRRSDLDGLIVPSWEQVVAREYEPWDEQRDGPRLRLRNDGTPEAALTSVRAYLDAERRRCCR